MKIINILKEWKNKAIRVAGATIDPMDKLLTKIDDLKYTRRSLKSDLAEAKAQVYVAQNELKINARTVTSLETQAREFAVAGQEAKAKLSLTKKLNLQKLEPDLNKMINKLESTEVEIEKALMMVEKKISELKQAKTRVEIQTRFSKTTDKLSDAFSGDVLESIDEIVKDAEIEGLKTEYLADMNFDEITESINLELDESEVDAEYAKLLN